MTRSRAELIAWLVGGAGLIGTAAGSIIAPAVFPYAWLAAFTTWLSWPLGCMGLLMIHALTGGKWGYAIRPQLVAGMTTLLLLLPALVPLIIVAPALYSWLRPGVSAHLSNGFYLNLPFFAVRSAVYLAVWFGLVFLIVRALRDGGSDAMLAQIAPAGLILLAITVTFAAIDTTMSLDPHFVSSAYGLIIIAEMGLFALSVSVFATAVAQPLDEDTLHNFGRLLLALVILWAYLDFMQLLIIWQSDLPEGAAWYSIRARGEWGIAAALVAGSHFFLPFFVLLSARIQRSRAGIVAVTALLILGQIIRGWWLVLPASGHGLGMVDVFAMLAVIGIAAAVALHAPQLPGMPAAVRGHA
jgi:hypothetical protein